jgi:acyl dehydratase
MVVDLAVDHRDRTVLPDDGLWTSVQVQNGQPGVRQANPVVAPDALSVRSTVALKAVDAVEHALIGRSKHSTKTAHDDKSGSD